MEPLFLTISEVLDIHRDQIERYGGTQGLRDIGLSSSAIAQPAASFGGKFLHPDIYTMAAAYLFHIVQNHPFIDGNKRTGAVATAVFHAVNDIDFDADESEFESVVLAVAEGKMGKAQIADFIRLNSNPLL